MFDLVYVTNVPAFYKVALLNELNRSVRVYGLFIAAGSASRHDDFCSETPGFPHAFLSREPLEKRDRAKGCAAVRAALREAPAHKVLVTGWELPEYWIAALSSRGAGVVVESTALESAQTGPRALAKRLFLKRVSAVLAAGVRQTDLVRQLGYRGSVWSVHGVGLIRSPPGRRDAAPFRGRFLYVGRLSREKNLMGLLEVFHRLPSFSLCIVGDGPLRERIRREKPANVELRDHEDNRGIWKLYVGHDALVLPSVSEPWGLVVEEALCCGLPVIVSRAAGCVDELVRDGRNGFVVEPARMEAWERAITEMASGGTYARLQREAARTLVQDRTRAQVAGYVEALAGTWGR